jgi:hypothetical protein
MKRAEPATVPEDAVILLAETRCLHLQSRLTTIERHQ